MVFIINITVSKLIALVQKAFSPQTQGEVISGEVTRSTN